ATTTSYRLNLRGPSFTVLTACSSTLVAVHLAVRSLQSGECDMAVVGGADVEFPFGHGYLWLEGGVKARDGHCRPFDRDATGTIFGSGAAAVVLRRLGDAEANHDHVSAVIRATALNNDGADKVSFGAPSMSGQVAVITEAMALAEVDPTDISYVEAHGTGTALGDPMELAALTEAYTSLHGGALPPGGCAVGSVKGNVGHLGSVAGIAGLVKTVLSLERGQIPPSVNFSAPNPRLQLGTTPFTVNSELRDWPRVPGRPRRAALSSFGIGGSNVHAVLEEAPQRAYPAPDGGPKIVTWSALTPAAADEARDRLRTFFADCAEDRFADASATLRHGRTHHAVRGAVVATSAAEAAAALGTAPSGRKADRRPVALFFPGQGSQAVGMAAGLYGSVPAFTDAFDRCLDLFEATGLDLRGCWRGGPGQDDINETRNSQPLLFSAEYAAAAMWKAAGLQPSAVLGHSIGELVAATIAGVFDLPGAVTVVAARARAIDSAPAGGMLAVAATPESVADVVAGPVVLAVFNGERQVVLSGPTDALADCAETLNTRGIASRPVPVSRSFHHPMLADAAAAVARVLEGIPLTPPTVPLYSGATGALLEPEQATSPRFWADQIVNPVRFAEAAEALAAAGPTLLVETGPGQVLTGLLKRHPAVRAGTSTVLATLPASAGSDTADLTTALRAAATVWTEGHDLDWSALGQHPPVWRVPLPGYPYQRERYWIEHPAGGPADRTATPNAATSNAAMSQPTVASGLPAAQDAAKGEPAPPAASPFSTVTWRQVADAGRPGTRRGGHALVLLPRDAEAAIRIVNALGMAGMRSVRLRPGPGFVAGEEFTVRPGVADDIDRVLADLSNRGIRPDLVVHAVAVEPWAPADSDSVPENLDASFFSLLSLVQRSVRAGAGQRLPEVMVVATGSADVSGADPVEPVKGTLHGFVRTLAKETPWLQCRLVDVSAATPVEYLADEVCRAGDLVVALRGRRRWVPTEVSWDLPAAPAPVVRPRGVYVLTGGMGGIGLELAKTLAATGVRPRIALLGRHVPDEDSPLGDASRADRSDRGSDVAATVEAMRANGAEVRMIACDVADKRQLKRAFDVVAGVFGPVTGVFHLAGVAGDGMLEVRDPARAAEVLRPKVSGTYALAEVVRA
ncbi:MAG TPA: type I polyketide synthase, partial [Micromonosporaceae bacterium]|nr:type I polyketide synthase [Micromonosporaceae bacterium]